MRTYQHLSCSLPDLSSKLIDTIFDGMSVKFILLWHCNKLFFAFKNLIKKVLFWCSAAMMLGQGCFVILRTLGYVGYFNLKINTGLYCCLQSNYCVFLKANCNFCNIDSYTGTRKMQTLVLYVSFVVAFNRICDVYRWINCNIDANKPAFGHDIMDFINKHFSICEHNENLNNINVMF